MNESTFRILKLFPVSSNTHVKIYFIPVSNHNVKMLFLFLTSEKIKLWSWLRDKNTEQNSERAARQLGLGIRGELEFEGPGQNW